MNGSDNKDNLFPLIDKLDLLFDAPEDRLILDTELQTDRVSLSLTRRILASLMQHYATFLQKSIILANLKLKDKDEALHMQHVNAIKEYDDKKNNLDKKTL